MNETEHKLLRAFKKNCRISTADLARELGIGENDVLEMIASLEKKNVICGYGAQIDWAVFGEETVTAMIEVKVTPQRGMGFDRIATRIDRFPEVDAVYLMSGGFDLMVLIDGKSMREVSRFVFEKLSTIDYISSTSTHFVLKKYKENGVIFGCEDEDRRIQGDI